MDDSTVVVVSQLSCDCTNTFTSTSEANSAFFQDLCHVNIGVASQVSHNNQSIASTLQHQDKWRARDMTPVESLKQRSTSRPQDIICLGMVLVSFCETILCWCVLRRG